ncbi:MAG TPA: c-type cytochrome domain-containing protein [Gemmataceae bacterium]|nr:c-type cytochrome domain-containing protein [Gemmataceae bacterium]
MSLSQRSLCVFFLAFLAAPLLNAAEPPKDKEAKEPEVVSYYRDVRPVFQQHCQGCHQPAKPQGGYVMTGHADLLKAGDKMQRNVVAGKPDESYLIEQITPHGDKPPAMPKGVAPLLERDVKIIKKWIAQGAKDDTPESAKAVVDSAHPPTYDLPPVISTIAYSPDSKLLAVAGFHEVLLHNADGSGLVARLVGLSERIQSLAFSPDGKLLAVAGGCPCRFGEIQVWEVDKKKLKLSVPVTFDTVYGVSWSPDGTKIAFGCADNTLRAIEANTGKQILYQGAHNDWVLETVFSTDASHLISVSRDRSLKLTEVATQRFIDNISSITPGALKGGLMTVDRHPKKDELLIGGADGTPKIYQMYRQQKRVIGDDFNFIGAFEEMPGRIFSARYSSDGARIVVGCSLDGVGEARVYQSITKPDYKAIGFAGLGLPATRGLSILLLLPSLKDKPGHLVCKLEGEQGPVYTVAYRPDGKQVATAGFDGKVRLNDPDTGKLLKEFVAVPLEKVTQAKASR